MIRKVDTDLLTYLSSKFYDNETFPGFLGWSLEVISKFQRM